MTDFNTLVNAIVKQESGGNYKAVGPQVPSRQDRALGKYQIMGANLPSWSQAYIGRQVSQQEFLDNPDLQDAVAIGKLKEYYNNATAKGLKGDDIGRFVATSWYAGPGAANSRIQNGRFVYRQSDLQGQPIIVNGKRQAAPSIKSYGDRVVGYAGSNIPSTINPIRERFQYYFKEYPGLKEYVIRKAQERKIDISSYL